MLDHPKNLSSSEGDCTRRFLDLHSRCSRWLFAYILSLVHNPSDAEDLLSETTATLWEKFDEFQPGTEFRAWACQIAKYKVLEWRKKQSHSPMPATPEFLEAVTQAHLQIGPRLNEQAAYLDSCVEQLPQHDRELLERRYGSGDTVKELARSLGRSIHWVYRRLNAIHEVLWHCIRRKMAEREGP